MKVPFKKPAPEMRVGLVKSRAFMPLHYPAGHPMRVYKDKKRALKRGE